MFDYKLAVRAACGAALSLLFVRAVPLLREVIPERMYAAVPGAIAYLHVDAPEAAKANGVVSAEEWSSIYPEITASMKANADNNYRISYLDEDPFLKNIYEGYGFAIDYTSAVGHSYTLEDVHKTERPHPLANCLTCKSPDFTKLVNDLGDEVYMYDFEETWQKLDESISCYNCHANQAGNAGELVVTHTYLSDAFGEETGKVDPVVLSCGQCHIEYYFRPENKATASPVHGLDSVTPEAALAYYNEIDFTDWVQESTGAKMLKVQHPEMETFMNGVHASLLNCADCHMALTKKKDGTYYHSHTWESPLENETLLAKCAECHGETDMVEFVHSLQDRVTAREKEVGQKLSDLKDALAAANQAGSMDEDALNEIRQLYREAQWFWDYCYVENSEGAHNSTMAMNCLDTSETKIAEAMEKLSA